MYLEATLLPVGLMVVAKKKIPIHLCSHSIIEQNTLLLKIIIRLFGVIHHLVHNLEKVVLISKYMINLMKTKTVVQMQV